MKQHATYTQSKRIKEMRNTHIDEFASTFAALNSILDEFGRDQIDIGHRNQGRMYSDAEPLVEGKHYTIDNSCGCGGKCSCPSKTNWTSRIEFDNILDDVEQVIYNDPATIVTFSDGSKVCVKACSKDTFNKETGLIYAIIKRLYANDVEENTGYLRSKGLGEKINKILGKAVDQKEAERERRKKQKAKKESAKKAELANEVSEQAAKESVEQIYSDEAKN